MVIALLFSCSSDDSGSSSSDDLIVGKWKKLSESENGVDQPLNQCDLMEMLDFKSNGDFFHEDYELIEGECVRDSQSIPDLITTYKWLKIAQNSYRLKAFQNGVEIDGEYMGFTTVFSNSNNKMTVTTVEEEGNVYVTAFQRQ